MSILTLGLAAVVLLFKERGMFDKEYHKKKYKPVTFTFDNGGHSHQWFPYELKVGIQTNQYLLPRGWRWGVCVVCGLEFACKETEPDKIVVMSSDHRSRVANICVLPPEDWESIVMGTGVENGTKLG
jgi:hypothetical protein